MSQGQKPMHEKTLLVQSGRLHGGTPHPVNPPIVRASTVLFPTVEAMQETRRRRETGEQIFSYGVRGTPTTHALEDAITALEQGERTLIYPSGLAALAAVLLSHARPGDHIAVIDTVYPPVRHLCTSYLVPRGVDVSYFAPSPEGLKAVLRPQTSLVLAETPGSGTFEVVDIPALADIARKNGSRLAVDNTWSAGLFLKPLAQGADISVQAATKYICGHSDTMLGTVAVKGDAFMPLFETTTMLGLCASPMDCYDALKGLRTLEVRLRQHEQSALVVAKWLAGRPDVSKVYHPALEGSPGHSIWCRDFTGSSGLFAFALSPRLAGHSAAFVNALAHFGIGPSWGGFESLALPVVPASTRSAVSWAGPKTIIRLHIGLEEPQDLIGDLERAFSKIAALA